jgi:hypothetical protein
MTYAISLIDAAELLNDVQTVWSRIRPDHHLPNSYDDPVNQNLRTLCQHLERGIERDRNPRHLVASVAKATRLLLESPDIPLNAQERDQLMMLRDIIKAIVHRADSEAPNRP